MKSEELLLRGINSSSEPVFVLARDGAILFYNHALSTLLGVSPEVSVTGAWFWPNFRDMQSEAFDTLAEFRRTNGERLEVRLNGTPLGNGTRWIRVVRHGGPQSGFHAQRMEMLGMIAGGIAHDFNNILAGILGHVAYLSAVLPAAGPHMESLLAIEEGGKKASTMTQQILSFSRAERPGKPTSVELNSLVTKTCSLLKGAVPRGCSLDVELCPASVAVLAHEGSLAQVLVNLVVNARDALSSQGKIVVRLGIEDRPEVLKRVFSGADLSSKRYVVLVVQDNGSGIPDDVQPHIFEPYFSTKGDKGTGLGLAMVKSIVNGYGGAIALQSEVNVGTSVSLYFPESALAQAQPKTGEKRKRRLQGGDERILVVDDESSVRTVVSMSLEHLGYAVESVSGGPAALERLQGGDEYPALFLLDMLMPEMSGEQLFFKLRELNPKARVLIMSGYAPEEAVQSVLNNGGLGFIQKPFTIEELSQKVREALDCEIVGD